MSQSVEQSPASVVITDINGNIEYVNSKFSEITEYKLSEVIGENSRILKSGLHSDEFYKILWETISSGNEWRGEFHNRSKNGKLIWESASISPIKNYSGKITHFVAVKEDITEKKRNYEELVAAKEQAEKSDKLKSTFLATMSHELRTPLNSIIGFAELISNEFLEHDDDVANAKLIYQSGHDLLSLSKKIVELLGGEMHLESELGKGSIFYFTLPNNNVIEKKKKTIPDSKIRKRYNWSGKKILIVEDVTSNYKLIEFILQQTNAAIIGAINGIQAIEVCKSNKDIDLVVMDLRLPEISGFEATKEIKKLYPNLPVIAQTSYALEGDKERSLNAGCDDYIVKPLDKELFLSKINKLLS